MKKLHEIVKEKDKLSRRLNEMIAFHKKEKDNIYQQIDELLRLEKLAVENIDIEKIQIAEQIIRIKGNPFGKTSDVLDFGRKPIAEAAIIDIANDCEYMKKSFFGNKEYSSYYQRCDCEYGLGPKHGGIVDKISLKNPDKSLTSNEKDACIYYIKNYDKITMQKKL